MPSILWVSLAALLALPAAAQEAGGSAAAGDAALALLQALERDARATAAPAEMAGIEFPVSGWDPGLMADLLSGPSFLDPLQDWGVPAAPPNESVETQEDLAALLRMQIEERTPAQRILIELENDPTAQPANILMLNGMLPSPDVAPELWRLVEAAVDEARWFVLREKLWYSRARPSVLEPTLRTLIPVPPHPAYPSGHAATYQAAATVLGRVNPACGPVYDAFAAEVAHRREIAGVHYPSDSEAGLLLGQRVAEALLDEGYLDPLISALREAAAAGRIPAPACPVR